MARYDCHDFVHCESCLVADEHTPATGHSINPEWSGYELCEECQAEYNSRLPVAIARNR